MVPVVHRKPRLKLDPHSAMGVVLTERQAVRVAERAGLSVVSVDGAGTSELWLTLRRATKPPR
jgi:hypothetical protein